MAEETKVAEQQVVAPTAEFAANAHVKSMEQYQEMYDRSISDPEGFWAEIAEQFVWKEKWSKVLDYTFENNEYSQIDSKGYMKYSRKNLTHKLKELFLYY